MLTFDPLKRISALNALEHEYFRDEATSTQTKSWSRPGKHAARGNSVGSFGVSVSFTALPFTMSASEYYFVIPASQKKGKRLRKKEWNEDRCYGSQCVNVTSNNVSRLKGQYQCFFTYQYRQQALINTKVVSSPTKCSSCDISGRVRLEKPLDSEFTVAVLI